MEHKNSYRKYRWNAFFYGRGVLETMQMDMLLDCYTDDQVKYPFDASSPSKVEPYLVERRMDKLMEDGFVKQVGNGFRIATKGSLHLGKCGYTAEFKKERRSVLSFWISLTAILLSLVSFFISILK